MKSGIPWNLKRVDEDTRQAVIEAARRAGLSVGEWLNRALAPEGAGYAEPEEASPQRPAARDLVTTIAQLKDRLDQIERNVTRPASGRTQKSVPEMVAELAREIENPDERARSSVEGLRARTARPENDADRAGDAIRDLDRRIAEMGERIAAPPPPADTGPLRLDDIRYQLNALLAQAPKMQMPAHTATSPGQAAAVDAALKALEDRIEGARAQLGEREQNAATANQIARVEAQIAEIGERLAATDSDRNRPPRQELASVVREISAHQRAIDDRAETLAMRRDQKALSAAMAALRTDIAALNEQVSAIGRIGAEEHGTLFDLARRIDSIAAETPVDRNLLSSIRADVESLRELVEDGAREATLGNIAARHDSLAAQVHDLMAVAPDRRQLDALSREVTALRRAFEADDHPHAVARLEARLAEIGATVDAALAGQRSPTQPDPVLEQLEERLREISFRVEGLRDTSAQTAVIAGVEQRLEERLDDIAGRLHSLADTGANAAVEAAQVQLEERLAEVVSRLGGMFDAVPRQAASLETLHHRLEGVVERIDELGAMQREPSARLDIIAAEIQALRAELADRPVTAAANTDHLEAQIRGLAAHLETVVSSTPDASALADLERQVAYIAGELDETRPRVAALAGVEENLARLQALLADTTRDSIAGARAEAQQAVTQLSEIVAEYEIDSDLVRNLMRDLEALKSTAGVSDEHTHTQLESVSETLSDVVERLTRLEREALGAMRPHTRDANTEATTQIAAKAIHEDANPTEAGVAQSETKVADRRADFIAAARRAAQAAAARVAADQYSAARADTEAAEKTAEDATERKPGAFARISQAIRNRRRPLLLAAAAIVIAIGAMQIYGKLTPSADDDTLISAERAPAPEISQFRDVAAEAAAKLPTMPQVAEPALVLPAATPNTAITFAEPEAVTDRFDVNPEVTASAGFGRAGETPAADEDVAVLDDTSESAITPASIEQPALPAGYASGLDPRLGSEKLLRAADNGDPVAAFEVARRYAEGTRLPKDLAKAAQWYRRAAESGVAVAQYRLASLHERGQGVPRSLIDAVNWYQRAADQGNVNAMHNLAVLMSEGVEGTPDHDKALQWFLAAADYGVRDSQYNLGVIFARGLGPAQDLPESFKWFAIAASQGDNDAAQRRDEVAKAMNPDELAEAKAAVAAWHVKPTLAEANGVSAPEGSWDDAGVTIAEADRQALVRKIQILLAEQGYDPGPADGMMGPKTVDAVRAYQRRIGQPETGQIDSTLVAALADGPM